MPPNAKILTSEPAPSEASSTKSSSQEASSSSSTSAVTADEYGFPTEIPLSYTGRTIPAESIRIENKIYSARDIAKIHPGGELFVRSFAGRDATAPFLTYHRRQFPHSRVEHALEFTDPDVKEDLEMSADYLELCARVEKVLPRMQSFAPYSYFLKATFIWGTFIGLEMYMHYTKNYNWFISALCGWFLALVGLNVQHDANHGALSKKAWVNRFWGLSQNWMGASSLSWIHQHVVQHHVFTNDVKLDPDIEGRPIIRLNPLKPVMKYHAFQYAYFFFLILGYGMSFVWESFLGMLRGDNYTPLSPLVTYLRHHEAFWSLVFFFRWGFLPLYQVPSIWTLVHIFPMLSVAGWWLSFFFTLSHNFEGVQQLDGKRETTSMLYNQVVTSSNVCGWKLAILNGGLNYQIEHHLFPRVHHGHYATISPVVKQFCKEKGIPYKHFDTLAENTRACINHLCDMGTKDVPKSAAKLQSVKNKKSD